MKQIRFGIIGCGDVTEVKSGPAFNRIEGASLEMVMRRDPNKLQDYARRHGVPRHTTDYLALLGDPDIDAVYIATPPDSHAFYTMEAARHLKPVYVEKPMAHTVAECRSMVAACREAGVPLYVAYYRRGQPKFLKARELIASGALGDIRSFHYLYADHPPVLDPNRAWLMDRAQAGGGLLYDVGSHMINMLLFLLGDPVLCTGRSVSLGTADKPEDINSAILRFRSGAQGSVQLSFCAAEKADRLWISGTRGSLSLAIMSNDPLELRRGGQVEQLAFDPIPHVQQPYIELVVRSLQGKGCLDTTGAEGLLTQELLETIDRSGEWTAS